MTEIQKHFQEVSAAVDEVLEQLVPKGPPVRLYDAVRWSLFAGGKRFRPALLCIVGEAFGAERCDLLRTAAAFEMVHTYSLIHDDLPAMDDDDMRRGRATCHVKYDEATAILAGDVLQSLAFRTIAEDDRLPAEVRIKVLAELADAAAKMVDGQQLDLDAEGAPTTIEDLETIHTNKTGAMIRAAARCGAMVAGAGEKELDAVSAYASALGLLFQITDDILDVTATSEVLGKTAGKDVSAEKATYPGFYGLDKALELAQRVHGDALVSLSGLERPTQPLADIADFILKRSS